MKTGSGKLSPRLLIAVHRRTYRNLNTQSLRLRDVLALDVPPVAAAGLCMGLNVHLNSLTSVGLLTVTGLMSAFLFGLMIQILDRAESWSDSEPPASRDTGDHALFLEELAASAGFASVVSIAASVVFVVASTSTGWVLRTSSAIGIGLGTCLFLTMLMVLNRVFALTLNRTSSARTGVDRTGTLNRNRHVA